MYACMYTFMYVYIYVCTAMVGCEHEGNVVTTETPGVRCGQYIHLILVVERLELASERAGEG